MLNVNDRHNMLELCSLLLFFSKLVAYKIILKLHNKTTFHYAFVD